jgi:hypothetical protein
MFTLIFVIMLPFDGRLNVVYVEAPPERFESIEECVAWRDVLRLDALAAGWDVTVAECVPDDLV